MSAYVPPLNVMRSHRGTVGALFHARVTVNPTHRAVVDGDRVLNYEELEERSNQLANALLSQGLQQGDRVGLLARNRLEYVEVELAAAKAGLIVACLNWRLAGRELQHCINLVEASVLIVQEELAQTLDRLDLKEHRRIMLGGDYEAFLDSGTSDFPDVDIDPETGW